MRELFEQCRVSGTIRLKEGFMRDALQVVYSGDDEKGTTYYNSGGRSLIVERPGCAYKIHGVDPDGLLTRKVAASPKNRLRDVVSAARIAEEQCQNSSNRMTYNKKPFGVLTYDNTENAECAFDRLNSAYAHFGITPPCNILCRSRLGMKVAGEEAYQLLFALPSAERDLRIWEFCQLLRERLAKASRSEIQQKLKPIGRIFGRFAAWSGFATGILASYGLLPSERSWVPQNFVLSEVDGGYGALRVDHTSTKYVGREAAAKEITGYIKSVEEKKDISRFFGFQFTMFPEAFQVAALFPERTDELPVPKSLSPQERVFAYYSDEVPRNPPWDASEIDKSHLAAFMMGIKSLEFDRNAAGTLAIPESYLRVVLE